jgi:hypothetical protein
MLRHRYSDHSILAAAQMRQLIALGNPYASSQQLRAMLQNVLAPQSGGYSVASFSAGTTSFPPMSPLVSPYLPAMAR